MQIETFTWFMTGLTQPASIPATIAAPISLHSAGVEVPRATPLKSQTYQPNDLFFNSIFLHSYATSAHESDMSLYISN